MKIKEIWIEFEHWADGELDPIDDNSDVIVTLESGEQWVASFFTYKNIATLTEKNRTTGECLNGRYFWARDLILIDELTREQIEQVINDLIENEDFEKVFSQAP